jgi:hypothetical protein
MPKVFCEYCDKYIKGASLNARRDHNRGWRHKANVRNYYSQFVQQGFRPGGLVVPNFQASYQETTTLSSDSSANSSNINNQDYNYHLQQQQQQQQQQLYSLSSIAATAMISSSYQQQLVSQQQSTQRDHPYK